MNINDFTAQAAEEIVRYLPEHVRRDVSVETTEVMKINDQIMHGLVFHSGDEPAPAYYLDEMYELYLHGESVEDLLRGLAQAYVETYAAENSNETGVSCPSLPVPAEIPDLSSRAVGRKAGVRLLSKEYNREFLKTVPYRDVGNDYALIADIQIKASDGGVFSTVITNSMAEEYNYDMGTIFDAALENAWRSNAASLRGASELTDGAAEEDGKEISYVLTTNRQRFGAAALFYPGTQAMIAHVLDEDYFAIPSSLHEFIIIRESQVRDPLHLKHLVREANQIIVSPDDVLSDNILKYSRSTGTLSLLEPADNGLVQNCENTV